MDPVKLIAVIIVIFGGIICTQRPVIGLIAVAIGVIFFFIGGFKKQ